MKSFKYNKMNEARRKPIDRSVEDELYNNPYIHSVDGKINSMTKLIKDAVSDNMFLNVWEYRGNKAAEGIVEACEGMQVQYMFIDPKSTGLDMSNKAEDILNTLPCHPVGDASRPNDTVTVLIIKNFTSISPVLFPSVAILLQKGSNDAFELNDNIIPVVVSYIGESSFAKYDALEPEIRQNIFNVTWDPQISNSDDDDDLNDSYKTEKTTDINESKIISIAAKATIDALRKINESKLSDKISNFKSVNDFVFKLTAEDYVPINNYFKTIDRKNNTHISFAFMTYVVTPLYNIYDDIDDIKFDVKVKGRINDKKEIEYKANIEKLERIIIKLNQLRNHIDPADTDILNEYNNFVRTVMHIRYIYGNNGIFKVADYKNIVPQLLAEKLKFTREQSAERGLEIWRKSDVIDKRQLCSKLGIDSFTSYDEKGNVTITVKPYQIVPQLRAEDLGFKYDSNHINELEIWEKTDVDSRGGLLIDLGINSFASYNGRNVMIVVKPYQIVPQLTAEDLGFTPKRLLKNKLEVWEKSDVDDMRTLLLELGINSFASYNGRNVMIVVQPNNSNEISNINDESTTVNEGLKMTDSNNIVPQDLAERFGFEPEYRGDDGLEIWGKSGVTNPRKLLSYLGIDNFTSYNVKGKATITVRPETKNTSRRFHSTRSGYLDGFDEDGNPIDPFYRR